MLKIHQQCILDPHQIPDTLNWIFNLSTEPVIKFGHQINQKSAATIQHQKHHVKTVLVPKIKNTGQVNIKKFGPHKSDKCI